MSLRCLAFAAVLSMGSASAADGAARWTLDLAPYQDPHGVLTVRINGDFADPYFALRALLSAERAGADIQGAAGPLIAWLLPRQLANGSFPRFCNRVGAGWGACAEADADDAMTAMWAELLYLAAPCGQMAPAWRDSAARALRHLAHLRDPVRGTYRISASKPTSLLMDNVEIYNALSSIAARQACAGQPSTQTWRSATRLRRAIDQTFRPAGKGDYRISTQARPATGFYPDTLAQVYPVLFDLLDTAAAHEIMTAWLKRHQDTWLARSGDVYPWGLVALAAQRAGVPEAAATWLERSAPLRHGVHWNILEEAAFQALCQVHRQAPPCQALVHIQEP